MLGSALLFDWLLVASRSESELAHARLSTFKVYTHNLTAVSHSFAVACCLICLFVVAVACARAHIVFSEPMLHVRGWAGFAGDCGYDNDQEPSGGNLGRGMANKDSANVLNTERLQRDSFT